MLTKDEYKNSLPPLKYPRHLLELGGLLEALDNFQNEYHYSVSSNDLDSDKDTYENEKKNA